MWRKGNPRALLEGMQTCAAAVESGMEIPKNIKNWIALRPSHSTSGNTYEETRNTNSKEYMHPCVHSSIIYNGQHLEAAQAPINRWVNKKSFGPGWCSSVDWVRAANQRAAVLIPRQGMCLGCRRGPQWGSCDR